MSPQECGHHVQMCPLGGELKRNIESLDRDSPASEHSLDAEQVPFTTHSLECSGLSRLSPVKRHGSDKR